MSSNINYMKIIPRQKVWNTY